MSDPKDVKAWAEIRQEPRNALVQLPIPEGSERPSIDDGQGDELDIADFAPELPPTHRQLGDDAPRGVKAPGKHPGKFAAKARVAKGPGKAGRSAAKAAKAWARSKGKKAKA